MAVHGTGPYQALSQEEEAAAQPALPLDFAGMPALYFNEGHYSPPSSTDDLVEKTALARHRFLDDEDEEYYVPDSPTQYLDTGIPKPPRKVIAQGYPSSDSH